MTRALWHAIVAWIAALGLFAAIFAIVSCDSRPPGTPTAVNQVPGELYEFTLGDGTHCIAWKPASGGAIACDFKGEE